MTIAAGAYKEPRWFRTIACLSPFLTIALVNVSHGWRPFTALAVLLAYLVLSAFLMSYAVFLERKVRLAFILAVLLFCLGWGWQLVACFILLPSGSLESGYFSAPGNGRASVAILILPAVIGATGLLGTLGSALRQAWRSGQRWVLLALAIWWLIALVIFLAPDIYLALQGYGVPL
jgi:hypothetical protein